MDAGRATKDKALPASALELPRGPAALSPPCDKLIEIMREAGRPLTVRQLASLSRMQVTEVAELTETLCQIRLVRRLNTIVESYTALFR